FLSAEHEGSSYWSSYIGRFTWWADVMREAMGINAYNNPYFSKIGYYAMYLLPPGKVGGGFGDLTARKRARNYVPLMSILAAQAQNPHWHWYVEQLGGADPAGGYIGFLRGQLPKVQAKAPDDLPASRLFAGTGQAYLNSSLTDASDSVQIVFKSSPFGTQSHGYESNNSFLLWAYGQRLLIRSGYRDIYGSAHHQNWMWSTRSTNCITINGKSQMKHTARAQGKITAVKISPALDVVLGDATESYASDVGVDLYKRAIIFVKPDLVVVYDRLRASEPSIFEYWLHAVNEFDIEKNSVNVRNGDVGCEITFHSRKKLSFAQTNEYDPNPRPRITLREWHLTAGTSDKAKSMEFITVYRPYRIRDGFVGTSRFQAVPAGYFFEAESSSGRLTALLPTDDGMTLEGEGLQTTGAIKMRLEQPGSVEQVFEVWRE
ncbi:MAG: heparinase II/III family protein, partial [Phycisphaerales bacterium]